MALFWQRLDALVPARCWQRRTAAKRDDDTRSALQETCQICFDEVPVREMRSARCRHLFCMDCWRGYVANAVNSGPSTLNLRCPLPECSAAVSYYVLTQKKTKQQGAQPAAS